jgi:hypothetical protein
MDNHAFLSKSSDKSVQRQLIGGLGICLGVGASLAGYSFLHEPFNIGLEQLTIHLPQANGHLPSAGLRVLHLSDTHFQGLSWREQPKMEQVRRLAEGLTYDLLIHTGDFWHEERGLHNVLSLLESLPRPRLGSYGVLGNHDYVCYSHSEMWSRNWERYQQQNGHRHNGRSPTVWQNLREVVAFAKFFMNRPFVLKRVHFNNRELLQRRLAEQGMQLLTNRSVHLLHAPGTEAGVDLHLAGVDDVSEGWPNLHQAFAGIPTGKPTILLSHNPDIVLEAEAQRADVILAGHTHGGQIVLPWVGAVHTHSEGLRRRQAAGHLRRGKTQLFVTRGIGEGIPVRFRARPQVALITLYAA